MDQEADDSVGSFYWSKEKLTFLIDSFAAEPLLWDPNHSDYYSHPARLQVYARMSQTLGCDGMLSTQTSYIEYYLRCWCLSHYL